MLDIPPGHVLVWTDSTVVLAWLNGNFHQFKTIVNNWVSEIMELISPIHWHYVSGTDNHADSALRGLCCFKLLRQGLWWTGPQVQMCLKFPTLTMDLKHWLPLTFSSVAPWRPCLTICPPINLIRYFDTGTYAKPSSNAHGSTVWPSTCAILWSSPNGNSLLSAFKLVI